MSKRVNKGSYATKLKLILNAYEQKSISADEALDRILALMIEHKGGDK